MIELKLLADILLAAGSLIGLATKLNALRDKDTTWPRKSSLTNVITYPITGILPFILLGVWITASISIIRYLIRIGIYLFRAPENEDWLGRKV